LSVSARTYDVIVIGAGAAGLMCAIEAGKRGRSVVVLEHADRPGKKILISGGGRCNFTNAACRPENFLSSNPHFARSALARYTPADFVQLVEKHRIQYHEKKLGQLFCDRSAQDITRMLDDECRAAGVQTITRCDVRDVRHADGFAVQSSAGEFGAPALVIATGGLSIPKIGATPFGYELARKFGLKIVPCRPALVPLTFNERDRANYVDLAGVAADVRVALAGQTFKERMLITHRGLSGPAILQISSYWKAGDGIQIDLLPGIRFADEVHAQRRGGDRSSAKTMLAQFLPRRLVNRWLEVEPGIEGLSVEEVERRMHAWCVRPNGTEGYAKAEVTAGGIDTGELSSKTMESRRVPGLYFVGEVVDVTGHLGGHNFQWAWASGFAAGQAV
jgi:predicted Rossmann fold flavoprotein